MMEMLRGLPRGCVPRNLEEQLRRPTSTMHLVHLSGGTSPLSPAPPTRAQNTRVRLPLGRITPHNRHTAERGLWTRDRAADSRLQLTAAVRPQERGVYHIPLAGEKMQNSKPELQFLLNVYCSCITVNVTKRSQIITGQGLSAIEMEGNGCPQTKNFFKSSEAMS